jgi:hypothetical protein
MKCRLLTSGIYLKYNKASVDGQWAGSLAAVEKRPKKGSFTR